MLTNYLIAFRNFLIDVHKRYFKSDKTEPNNLIS